jgi:RHS repeat-associated protein
VTTVSVRTLVAPQTVFYHADGLGSMTELTDGSGTVVQRYSYEAFGALLASRGTVTQPYTFIARELDPETGLYHYRARTYDPTTGRFLQEDPVGFEGGDYNLYRYVLNDPVNLVDPFGLFALTSVDAAIQGCLRQPTPVLREACLLALMEILPAEDPGLTKCQKALDQVLKFGTTAAEWIAKYKQGSIHREFPGQLLDKTLEEIRRLAQAGDRAGQKAWKLLNDTRFDK